MEKAETRASGTYSSCALRTRSVPENDGNLSNATLTLDGAAFRVAITYPIRPSRIFGLLCAVPAEGHILGVEPRGIEPRPPPCKGSAIVCWTFLELAECLQIEVFGLCRFLSISEDLLGLLHSCCTERCGEVRFGEELRISKD
jgi:hypothetical protein